MANALGNNSDNVNMYRLNTFLEILQACIPFHGASPDPICYALSESSQFA